ncbi:MAG: hypothetical protein JXA11_12715 [Phycisphaerae bacterium]|nr:hypothetical protein [Phycisphaerae bacterium]
MEPTDSLSILTQAKSVPRKPLRVLHGLTGAAGQPSAFAKAQRALGIHADNVCEGINKFGYPSDLQLPLGNDLQQSYSDFLSKVCSRYDVFHFYFRPFFFFNHQGLYFPTALDLLVLRAAGKVIIFHYRGSEARTAEKFRDYSPYNYVAENPHSLFTKFPTKSVEALQRFVRAVSHRILVPDPELQSYVPHSEIVPRGIDVTRWTPAYETEETPPEGPLIVHAPSRKVVKGTQAILQAVDSLRAKGLPFRFQLIENLPHDEARRIYQQASIIIDQLRIGWYGVLAVEGMALGKAVVAYIRDDLIHHLQPNPPLANANPDTITDVLRDLIIHRTQRRMLGRRGREFVEETHDVMKLSRQLIDLYHQEWSNPRPVDVAACLEYLMVQRNHTNGSYRKMMFQNANLADQLGKFAYTAQQFGWREAFRGVGRKILRAFSPRPDEP